jgi:hypothetical protein
MEMMRIKVEVGRGMFSEERTVAFQANGTRYTLIVDERDVRDDHTMDVRVVAKGEREALIDLPRETFTTGSRVRVPIDILQPAA